MYDFFHFSKAKIDSRDKESEMIKEMVDENQYTKRKFSLEYFNVRRTLQKELRKIKKSSTEKPLINAYVTFKSPDSVKKLLKIQEERNYQQSLLVKLLGKEKAPEKPKTIIPAKNQK
jgi:hypothetical protein